MLIYDMGVVEGVMCVCVSCLKSGASILGVCVETSSGQQIRLLGLWQEHMWLPNA